jgi:hypothetical protein
LLVIIDAAARAGRDAEAAADDGMARATTRSGATAGEAA